MYSIFCYTMYQSVATYGYGLCYLNKVLSPWNINTYLLKYIATIHLPEKNFMQKEEHFGFFEPFLPQQLSSFYSLSSAPSYYYSHTIRISHHNMFIGSNVWCSRQHRNPQFTDSLSLQWALKDVPVDLTILLGGLWAHLSGSSSCGSPESNLSKTHNPLCLSDTFNLCGLCTDCVYT